MKGKIRIASLAFVLVILLSIFTINVYADEDDDVVATDAAPVATEAPAPATQAPKPVATEAPKPVATAAPKATKAPVSNQTRSNTAQNNNNNNNYNNNNNNNNNNYSSNNNNQYQQSATQKAVVSATKATSGAVYNVEKEKVATGTLKKNDWASIAEKLNKSKGENSDSNDADSFSFIQDNNSDGDNGLWILYGGIALEVIAAIIIITLIALGVKRRKTLKRKYAEAGINPDAPRRQGSSAPQRAPHSAPPSRKQSRQAARRSKFDTDEIQLQRKQKPSNGRHYKPKH